MTRTIRAAEGAGRQAALLVTEFPAVRLQGEPLVYAEHPEYLGVWYDEQLNFERHVNEMVRKMQKQRGGYSQR